ncbi:alpha/beta fold hydrolase [Mycobacterium bourgelatii]|uniref:Non-heme haloperoxidase Hpx n=1 Tax=Mycobacterium bourgelatii TaxID=1273442 RepID=A0A7I9YKN0_MYCBU|nr:alpha/beta hydrolase [Mycobacterium bourgelatii]MCV6974596.1 alpha/beta hydrolase [Mycobacterium bourgelatii]GFG89063.1 non-heme haloperoxidase Hpx [Mycobacterium bourgelatii]
MNARMSQVSVSCPAPDALPPSQTLKVRAADGTQLHTQVFGPADGYPIVLTHGIVCASRAWAHQIADLSSEYRVIAFDHRGHGQSSIPRKGSYTLKHLASDLDCVLDATLAPHERAVIAGHSMGGITIAAWSHRYRHKVPRRADAVAMINTTTGDLLRQLKLLPVPRGLSPARVLAGRKLISTFGGIPIPGAVRIPTRYLIAMMAVAADAEKSAAQLVYELFAETSAAGRGGCAKMLVEELGTGYLNLEGLTVPTLVIGSQRDRLTPIAAARHIAKTAPNVIDLVELPGGHCSMLEQPHEVNRHLRALAQMSATRHGSVHRISS